MLGIRVFARLMYAVVKPRRAIIEIVDATGLQRLPPNESSAKSSYVLRPHKVLHLICINKVTNVKSLLLRISTE